MTAHTQSTSDRPLTLSPNPPSPEQLRLGHLTAIEMDSLGHVGGLLITNRFGIPLEFQCTTPVNPNRTQQILYGPTLVPYILCELIGHTLLEKVAVKPNLVLVDRDELLDLARHTSVSVLQWEGPANEHDGQHPPTRLVIGQNRWRLHEDKTSDRSLLESMIPHLSSETDLSEPFDRVREALNETVGSAVRKRPAA